MIIDPQKVQVLLAVLQRSPATLAEQIICREVAAWMAEQLAEQQAKAERKQAKETRRQGDKEPPA